MASAYLLRPANTAKVAALKRSPLLFCSQCSTGRIAREKTVTEPKPAARRWYAMPTKKMPKSPMVERSRQGHIFFKQSAWPNPDEAMTTPFKKTAKRLFPKGPSPERYWEIRSQYMAAAKNGTVGWEAVFSQSK
jgi:hypothetical protein